MGSYLTTKKLQIFNLITKTTCLVGWRRHRALRKTVNGSLFARVSSTEERYLFYIDSFSVSSVDGQEKGSATASQKNAAKELAAKAALEAMSVNLE